MAACVCHLRPRLVAAVWVLLAVTLVGSPGHADRASEPARTIDVPEHGGAYVVAVHPSVLTVLHFPARVRVAYAMQREPAPIQIEKHARSVTVQPTPGVAYGSLTVDTELFSVGILLRSVAHPEDADVLVAFRPLQLERELARRVEVELEHRWLDAQTELAEQRAALALKRRALAEDSARLRARVRDAAMQRLAEGVRDRHASIPGAGLARRAHVLMRLERVVWIGDDAFVRFSMHNRRAAPVSIVEAALRVGGVTRADGVAFAKPEDAPAAGLLGFIPPGERHRGVIGLRNAADWRGKRIALDVVTASEPVESNINPLSENSPDSDTTLSLSFWLRGP